MKWTRHYTGIEYHDPHGDGSGWYMSRNIGRRIPYMVRYSQRRPRLHLCLFLGYMNHLRMLDHNWGLEFSTNHIRLGLALPSKWNPLWWKLNPHTKAPKRRWFAQERNGRSLAMRFGWFCFGIDLPLRLARYLEDRQMARWEAEYEQSEQIEGNSND